VAHDVEKKPGAVLSPEEVAEFQRHLALWKDETSAQSSIHVIAMHPSYQRIIGMGRTVLPLLFQELQREPDQWFWALHAITGEDPGAPYEDFDRAVEQLVELGPRAGLRIA